MFPTDVPGLEELARRTAIGLRVDLAETSGGGVPSRPRRATARSSASSPQEEEDSRRRMAARDPGRTRVRPPSSPDDVETRSWRLGPEDLSSASRTRAGRAI